METDQLDVQIARQHRIRCLGERCGCQLRPGAVHHDVQPSSPGVDPRDGIADRISARHVRREGQNGVVATREIHSGLAQSFCVTGDDTYPDPLVVQRLGYRKPDAAARPGNQGNSAVQTQCHAEPHFGEAFDCGESLAVRPGAAGKRSRSSAVAPIG
jgi:hypothetical protein